ncbi:hypothetical protein R1flu_026736 [Riccia fluitans]|uniref:Uncharacterized protein n=1 Tax=Riccia fluitans TaxID=41844 RepID=A0ABD1XHI8_9MARC
MEWARSATNEVVDTLKEGAEYLSDTTPVRRVSETAESAYETAADYLPETDKNSSLTASLINTRPFSSFKPDPGNVWKAYLIYVLLAAACTLPWWSFVVAADYFSFLYPDSHILRLFPLFYFSPWLVVYVLFSAFGRQYTSWGRINLGLMISIFTLVAMPIIDGVFIKGDRGTTATFWVTLAAVALAGTGDSIAQGSLLGIASELPERLTHAYVVGASVSGVIMFVVRVITKEALNYSPTGLRISAIIYFSIAPVIIILVLSLFAYIHYQPEMSYYDSLGLGSIETVRFLLQDETTVTIEVAASIGIAAVAAGKASPTQSIDYGPVLSQVKFLAVAAAVTSLVSLFIFPGFLTEDLHSKQLGSWYQVLVVGTYLIFDLLGRILTKRFALDRHSSLFGASWARLLIILFFIFAYFLHGPGKMPMVFVLTGVLGATNGYLIGSLTILMPRRNLPNQAEPAGIIMAFLMTFGSLVGWSSSRRTLCYLFANCFSKGFHGGCSYTQLCKRCTYVISSQSRAFLQLQQMTLLYEQEGLAVGIGALGRGLLTERGRGLLASETLLPEPRLLQQKRGKPIHLHLGKRKQLHLGRQLQHLVHPQHLRQREIDGDGDNDWQQLLSLILMLLLTEEPRLPDCDRDLEEGDLDLPFSRTVAFLARLLPRGLSNDELREGGLLLCGVLFRDIAPASPFGVDQVRANRFVKTIVRNQKPARAFSLLQ